MAVIVVVVVERLSLIKRQWRISETNWLYSPIRSLLLLLLIALAANRSSSTGQFRSVSTSPSVLMRSTIGKELPFAHTEASSDEPTETRWEEFTHRKGFVREFVCLCVCFIIIIITMSRQRCQTSSFACFFFFSFQWHSDYHIKCVCEETSESRRDITAPHI